MARSKPRTASRPKRPVKPARQYANRVTRSVTDYEARVLARYAAGLPLKIKQLAIVIGISRAQIYRLGDKGPPYMQTKRGVKASRRVYFAKDVEPWLRQHTLNVTRESA